MSDPSALAQDPGEPFDILDYLGRPTGRVKTRAEVHRDGDWHRALHIWIAGRDATGEPFLMFQRRSAAKDSWPDHYDATVGGHYRAGETFTQTLRETDEEIGLSVTASDLRSLGVRIAISEEPPLFDRELQDVYLLLDDRRLTSYRPHPLELSALARFPLRQLLPFFAGELVAVNGEAFSPGEASPRLVTARHGEFIPRIDNYCLSIAIAAHNALRGDRYVAL